VVAASERVVAALERARAAVAERRDLLAAQVEADSALSDSTSAELRACAQDEAGLHERLRKASEAVTAAEVRAQQARDRAAEQTAELKRIAARLGLDPTPARRRSTSTPAAISRRAWSGSPAAVSSSVR